MAGERRVQASGTGKLENACAVAYLPLIRACLTTLRGDIATVLISFQPPRRTSMTGPDTVWRPTFNSNWVGREMEDPIFNFLCGICY